MMANNDGSANGERQDKPKSGKVALVTGGAQGIGLAFAERLAREGATVVVADIQSSEGLCERLLDLGAATAEFFEVDVSDADQVRSCCTELLERHGCCDILVNNAGIYPRAELAEISLELWRRTMATNVESMFLFCQALAPRMRERGYGRIVNLSSDTLGLVISGFSHYMASKAAVIGFSRGLASELGPYGITVNIVAPGRTRTPSTERGFEDKDAVETSANAHAIRRLGEPGDVVGAMSFLTSDDAAYITAHTLVVDGGLVRSL